MGFVHFVEKPTVEEISHRLPELSDRALSGVVRVSQGYAALRSAVLALAGVCMLRELDIAGPGDLPGVIAAARMSIEQARASLGSTAACPQDVARRVAALRRCADVLGEELAALARDGYREVDTAALHKARFLLAATALPAVGMRHYASVSCAGYLASDARDLALRGHEHSHAEHGHGHQHHHEH